MNEVLKDLAKAKIAFQQRTILTVMGVTETTESRMEEGDICCLCEQQFSETYGRPLACEECGGDGVLDNAQEVL